MNRWVLELFGTDQERKFWLESREVFAVVVYLLRQYQLEEVSVQNFNTAVVPPAGAVVIVAPASCAPLLLALAVAVALEAHALRARRSVVATAAGEGVEESGAFVVVNVELQPPKEPAGLQPVQV